MGTRPFPLPSEHVTFILLYALARFSSVGTVTSIMMTFFVLTEQMVKFGRLAIFTICEGNTFGLCSSSIENIQSLAFFSMSFVSVFVSCKTGFLQVVSSTMRNAIVGKKLFTYDVCRLSLYLLFRRRVPCWMQSLSGCLVMAPLLYLLLVKSKF